MLYRLRDSLNRARLARACQGIYDTPPVRTDPQSDLLLFTQLQHKDVLLALLAFKSFAKRVPIGSLGILDDGSLTTSDRKLLAAHLPGVAFYSLSQVQVQTCPTGGCWERLLWIAKLSREHYVVQLDSDTLTLADLPDVVACVKQRRSFVIGTWDNQILEPMSVRQADATKHLASQPGMPHVQLLAEANFNAIEDWEELRYVRGCAGFAGFARQSVDQDFIERVSRQMMSVLGDSWRKWGSEQVMSNIVVANAPNAVVLPHPKHCDCTKFREDVSAFVHFIGSCRFTGDTYRRLASQVIAEL